jgi:hypothetical protein
MFAGLWKTLTGGSIWPDMWSDMLDQTRQGMGDIQSVIGRGLGSMETGFGGFAGEVGGGQSASQVMHVTIPITVQNMTGEVSDLDNLARRISVELANAARWRQ